MGCATSMSAKAHSAASASLQAQGNGDLSATLYVGESSSRFRTMDAADLGGP